jgi:trk system potassium uptake protein TrkA
MGSLLASMLTAEGCDVAVIDRDSEAFELLGSGFNGLTVQGTGIDTDILTQAGADRADALAAITNDDSVNLMVAQLARDVFKIPNVVARNNDPSKELVFSDLNVRSISPKQLAARQAKVNLLTSGVWTRSTLGNGEVNISELRIPAELDGSLISTWEVPGRVCPIAVVRDGVASVPAADFSLRSGDVLLLSVAANSGPEVEARLEGEKR